MLKRSKGPSWMRAAPPLPSLPVPTFAEDFSLIVRAPRRLRVARGRVIVLS